MWTRFISEKNGGYTKLGVTRLLVIKKQWITKIDGDQYVCDKKGGWRNLIGRSLLMTKTVDSGVQHFGDKNGG